MAAPALCAHTADIGSNEITRASLARRRSRHRGLRRRRAGFAHGRVLDPELRVLLTTAKREEIRTILTEAPEFYKRVYKRYPAPYAASSPSAQTTPKARPSTSMWQPSTPSQS